MTKDRILEALRAIEDPDVRRDIVSIGAIRRAAVCEGRIGLTLAAPGATDPVRRRELARAIETALRESAHRTGDEIDTIEIEFLDGDGAVAERLVGTVKHDGGESMTSETPGRPRVPPSRSRGIPGVSHIVAVGAGKGGVGKSTVAVNLAVGLARAGHAVGLMDGDIYGPSLPTMMGLEALEPVVIGNRIQPFFVHGVKCMTIGKLVEREKPLIWRGPMAHGAFKQLAEQTEWGELDYLIIDLPPGTGDVSLTMAQLLRLDGAVIVCTPQKVAQDDAVRAARMFQQLGIDVLGVVENMSCFITDDGTEHDLFGRGGAEQMAQRLGTPYLGALPIRIALRKNADSGEPTKNFVENPELARELQTIVDRLEQQVALASMGVGEAAPTLTVH